MFWGVTRISSHCITARNTTSSSVGGAFIFYPYLQSGIVRKFNALGMRDHGQERQEKRSELVQSFTADWEGGPIYVYKGLNRDEMQVLIDGMSKTGAKSK